MRLMILTAVAGALLLAACGSGSTTSSGKTAVASPAAAKPTAAAGAPTAGATAPAAASTAGAQPAQNGGHKTYSAAPPMTIDPNKRYFATIKMDIGDIKLELYPKNAPVTVNNFVFLARDHYYDGVTFHRVIPGFVAQAGDPTGTGSGGPGYTIKDEVNSAKFLDGTIGMAKTAAPNSAGSQWFIDYAPQSSLDGGYTTFGQLIEGRDVLDKIAPRDPQRATTPGTKINTVVIDEQ
jgi:cyclophilin family peptidyl-prolyl cis-trans isomerase